MRKTGVIWVGHADYLCENTSAIQEEICKTIQDIPSICVSSKEIATSEQQAVAATRAVLREQDCCGAVIILATWVECNVVMAALKELRGAPCLFWGFPLEEAAGRRESTGSYVSATMFAGVVRRLGLPSPFLFTSWKEQSTVRALRSFSEAAGAIDSLFYAKIGLVGYTSMSIYTGTFDHVLLRYKLGPEVEQMDTYSLIRAAEAVPKEEIDKAERRLRSIACCKSDYPQESLSKTLALYVALRELCRSKGWNSVNVKCQYELSKEYKVVPCVALSLLAEDGIAASCEGDMMVTVSMLLMKELAQQTVWYGDSLTSSGNVLQFSPCGFLPFSMANGAANVQKFMDHPGFTGVQVSGVLRPEKVTFLRIIEDIGGYHLLYGTGDGIETEPRGGCMPALNVKLDGDISKFLQECSGQHYAVAYGDLSQQIEHYALLTGMEARRV